MSVRRRLQPVDEGSPLERRVRDLARWARLQPVEDPPPPHRRPVDLRLEDRRPHETPEQAWERLRTRLSQLNRLDASDRHLAYLDRCRAARR